MLHVFMHSVLYIATVHFTTIVTETHFLLNLVIVHNHYPSACRTSSTFSPCFSPLARWGQIECQKKCQIECQNIRQIECQKDCQNICQIECQKECQNNMSGWGSLQVTSDFQLIFEGESQCQKTPVGSLAMLTRVCALYHPGRLTSGTALCKGRNGRCAKERSATFSTLAGESHMRGAAGNQSLPHTLNWTKVFKKFF